MHCQVIAINQHFGISPIVRVLELPNVKNEIKYLHIHFFCVIHEARTTESMFFIQL